VLAGCARWWCRSLFPCHGAENADAPESTNSVDVSLENDLDREYGSQRATQIQHEPTSPGYPGRNCRPTAVAVRPRKTLAAGTQIVGKIRLAREPWLTILHVVLYVFPAGT